MRTEIVRLVDDIDGSEAAETVQFAVDGVGYEIDLSADHATALRESFDEWVDSSRKLGKVVVGSRTVLPVARGRVADRKRSRAIRSWARSQGRDVADRGRIPAALAEEFDAAHA